MKKLRNMRKSDLIYDRLADRISMMADGDPFPSVRELMTEFEASQFSVLPAVKKLQKQGFLKSYIGRGSFVCRRARERQAKLVLLTSDWPSYGNAEFDRLFLAEAGRRNHRVRVVHYPFASDVYSMLDEIRGADAILLEPLRIDSFTAEQLRSILQAPAPVIVCRAEIPINGIRYVAGNAMMAGSVTTNYLHSMGHRRIGILWTEPHNRTCATSSTASAPTPGSTGLKPNCWTAPPSMAKTPSTIPGLSCTAISRKYPSCLFPPCSWSPTKPQSRPSTPSKPKGSACRRS